MSTERYLEFEWHTNSPGNGESGVGLIKRIVDLVRQIENVTTICDLGCGNGYLASQLGALGYSVTGIDASKSGIDIAKSNHANSSQSAPATFVQSLIDKDLKSRLSLPSVDLVISSDVVEHLYRPSDLFEAAQQLLKPGGHILVTTPYHGYLKNVVLAASGMMDNHFSALHDGGHIKFFSVRTLSTLMERHSFTNLQFSYYGRGPFVWKNMLCHGRRSN
jgi:2-polyprenyl-3-methyl-5-hydroxy-6-metoxy-1,4-benzoquinol methylase